MTENDACELLGLQSGASPEALKGAYRRMSLKVHPDQGGSAALFRQVQEAYELLTKKRFGTAQDIAGAAEAQKAAAEKRRKETERQQRQERERRQNAETGPRVNMDWVKHVSQELESMRDSYTKAKRGRAVDWGVSPDQAQHLLNQIDPLERTLTSVLAGQRSISVAQANEIDAKFKDLQKKDNHRLADLLRATLNESYAKEQREKEAAAKKRFAAKSKKKKFGFFKGGAWN